MAVVESPVYREVYYFLKLPHPVESKFSPIDHQ